MYYQFLASNFGWALIIFFAHLFVFILLFTIGPAVLMDMDIYYITPKLHSFLYFMSPVLSYFSAYFFMRSFLIKSQTTGIYVDKTNQIITLKARDKIFDENIPFSSIKQIQSTMSYVSRQDISLNITLITNKGTVRLPVGNEKNFYLFIFSMMDFINVENEQTDQILGQQFNKNLDNYQRTGKLSFEMEHPIVLSFIIILSAIIIIAIILGFSRVR